MNATEKQIAYLNKLIAEKHEEHMELYRADVAANDIRNSTRNH